MSLVTVGTMAFDTIETPFGKAEKIIGGSATYVAYAAANFYQPIKQISIVGNDFPQSEFDELNKKGVSTEGVEIVKDEPSFFWSGKYHLDMNTRDTLVTDLNVLAKFDPEVPESYQDCQYLMIGNLMPSLQMKVINGFKNRPKLIVLDTMNFWMDTAWDDLQEVIKMVDVLVLNDSEARQLTNEYSLVKAAKSIMSKGPKFVVIKKGEHGALLFNGSETFVAPALLLEEVFDPTGAGDTFAGGFIGHLAKTDDFSFENMKKAVIVGSAMASFCVEKFGTERLKEISQNDIIGRIEEFSKLTNFDKINA